MTEEQKKRLLGAVYKENMTEDEVFEALANKDKESVKVKTAFDKASSELAELKKKQASTLNDSEKEKLELTERIKALETDKANLEKEKQISTMKAQYIALGYEQALAQETAEAYVNGDTTKLIENQTKFIKTHDEALKASLLGNTPKPGGGDKSAVGLEQFKKMGYSARVELLKNNPNLYNQLVDEVNKTK